MASCRCFLPIPVDRISRTKDEVAWSIRKGEVEPGEDLLEMGLGLVRLLQDARRFEEARTTLYSLENGFPGVAKKSVKPNRKLCRSHVAGTPSFSSGSASTRIGASEKRPQALSIA